MPSRLAPVRALAAPSVAAAEDDATGGLIREKLVGLMILPDDRTWLVDDNDDEPQRLDRGDPFDCT